MNTPPLLLGAAILFWGWQTGYWLAALPVAAVVEAHRWLALRWEFTAGQLNRVADFCTVLLILLGIYLYFTVGNPRAIILLFEWMPLVMLPLVLVQAFGVTTEFDLSVLFWSLRRQPPRRQLRVNLGYPYCLLWIVAASAANNRGADFYLGVLAFAAWALWLARPRHESVLKWGGLFVLAAALGYGGHVGLSRLQAWLEVAAPEWLNASGARTDPYRNTTDIGHIGELKQSDGIVLRVTADVTAKTPILLHRASYDAYDGATWIARNGKFAAISARSAAKWILDSGPASATLAVADYSRSPNPVLSLPAGALRIEMPDTIAVKFNPLGAVQAERAPGFFGYRVEYDPQQPLGGPPTEADRRVPRVEQQVFAELATTLGLKELEPERALAKVKAYFADNFQYATYRKPRSGAQSALADFVLNTRAGHCEYFASATVLLLRAAGIPARYATGFSVQEYSALEGAYLVRERHAHAWTEAYIDGKWRDVDTTPPTWFVTEAAGASVWAPLVDLWSWARFQLAQRMAAAGNNPLTPVLGWIAVPAVIWIAWRLYRNRRAPRAQSSRPPVPAGGGGQGADSEFYLIERHLAKVGWTRKDSESIAEWLARVGGKLPLAVDHEALVAIARLHYRYRFDPDGLPGAERDRLRSMAGQWLQRHASN